MLEHGRQLLKQSVCSARGSPGAEGIGDTAHVLRSQYSGGDSEPPRQDTCFLHIFLMPSVPEAKTDGISGSHQNSLGRLSVTEGAQHP